MPEFIPYPPDSLWKDLIEDLFEEFCAFFLPELYGDIDFTRPHESLEQELRQIYPESESGKRVNDKLFKVYLKNGAEKWLLVHVEVQGYRDSSFAERMFIYFYRVRDRFGADMEAIALFTDPNAGYRPARYQYRSNTVELGYSYRVYKVLEQQEEALLAQAENPFALAVLAALHSLQRGNSAELSFQFKMKLLRLLLERGYERQAINKLFIFIDHAINLPFDLEQDFRQQVRSLTQTEKEMPLTWENAPIMQVILEEERQKAREEAREEARAEEQQKQRQQFEEVVRKWAAKGLSLEDIADTYNVSIEEIQRILKQ